MTTRRLFVAAGLCMATGVRAADTAALAREVRARLVQEPVVRGAFEQRKLVKGFRNPLLATGEFVVSRQRGVLWRTREPFASTLVVTRDRVLARLADGQNARSLSARDEPGVGMVGETLFGVMAADVGVLAERFHMEGEIAGESRWRLVLLPRDAAMGRWLQRLELDGDRFLKSVRLLEGSGDQSHIRLSRHSVDTVLTPDEEAQFA
jgi:Outer membrane lipoprotein carrier protein LolA-like